MSQRLPTPGGDSGTWGDVLNGYLGVSLASDGTLNTGVVAAAQIANAAVGATAISSGAASSGQVLTANGWGTASFAAAASGAPTDATYITQTANGSLSAEQALSSLATGIVKVTTTTGVLSTASAGTDYASPTQALDTFGATTDITTRNASTSAHGLLPKLDSSATKVLLGDGTWGLGQLYVVNTLTTGYTALITDAFKILDITTSGGVTLVIPTNATAAFPIGTSIGVFQRGAGQITLAPASGATILSASSHLKLTGQYSSCAIRKDATDEWVAAGDLSA